MIRELLSLLPYLKVFRVQYAIGLICLLVTNAGQMYIPQILKRVVDHIATGKINQESVLFLVGELVSIALPVSIARFGWRFFIQGSARRIERIMRSRLFEQLLTLHSGFFSGAKVGDLMARATNDMNAIRMASGMALVSFTDGTFMTITILSILFLQSPKLAFLLAIPLPFITVMIVSMGSLVGRRFKRVQDVFASMSGLAQESVTGIRVITSFVKEKYFLLRFGKENDAYIKANMDLAVLWGLFHPVVAFFSGLTSVLLIYYGGSAVLRGEISPGEFVATFSYLEMLIWPMIGAGFTVNLLQRGAASLKRVNEILRTEPEIISPRDSVKEIASTRIDVRDLSFTYPGLTSRVIENASFSVKEGETVGILGKTGAGKTTLISFLPRIIDPPPGSVMLGGRDVREYDLSLLRRTFGMVPQETFLFSASIRDNISFAAGRGLDAETLARIAEITTIDRDLALFPKGFDTEIGERGLTLSGGQKQRIAIARALATDPAVLIFDDALSAVDTETEEKILTRLLANRRGKTNIIISHRIPALSRCDRILVLWHGRIAQEGSHEELVRTDGLYREIHSLQTVGAEVRRKAES